VAAALLPAIRALLVVLEAAVPGQVLALPRQPVDIEAVLPELDRVAGDRDHALDEILVRLSRVDEDDHLAAARRPQLLAPLPVRERQPEPIDELVDEDVI